MVKDIRKQGLKALKVLQDIDKDDVLEAIGLEQRSSAWASALGTIGSSLWGAWSAPGSVSPSLQERRGLPQRARGPDAPQGRRAGREPGRDEPVADAGHLGRPPQTLQLRAPARLRPGWGPRSFRRAPATEHRRQSSRAESRRLRTASCPHPDPAAGGACCGASCRAWCGDHHPVLQRLPSGPIFSMSARWAPSSRPPERPTLRASRAPSGIPRSSAARSRALRGSAAYP